MRELPAAAGQTTLHGLSSSVPRPESRIVQLSISFGEPVSVEKLRLTWSGLAKRHAVLRSAFRPKKSELIQMENDAAEASWRELDWSEVPVTELASRWANTLAEESARPIDLAKAPVIRFVTILLPGGSNHLLATHPRFLLDEDSWFLILCEWLEALEGQPTPELMGEPALEISISGEFWKTYLEGATSRPLCIYPGGERSPTSQSLLMDRDTTKAVAEAFGKLGSNSRDGILALWSYLLARLTLQNGALTLASVDVPQSAVGYQRNLLPCQLAIPADVPLKDWLRDFTASEKRRAAAATTPLTMLPAPFSSQGLSDFVSLFTWLPPLIGDRLTEAFPRWIKLDAKLLSQPLHPVELEVRDGSRLHLHLSTSLPAAETSLLLGRLEALIRQVLDQPDIAVGKLEISGATTPVAPPSSSLDEPRPVQEAIADIAKEFPDAIAIEDATGAILSFREVNDYAMLVAAHLNNEKLGQGWTIGCCLTQSPWMPVAILGVLHAGDTCLLLDPASDSPWLVSRADGGDAELIICDSGTEHFFAGAGKKLLVIDQEWSTVSTAVAQDQETKAPQIAMILTGSPGVTPPDIQSFTPSLLALATKRSAKLLDLHSGDRVLVNSHSGSAAFLESLLCSLQSGATALIGQNINQGIAAAGQPTHLRLISSEFEAFSVSNPSGASSLRHLSIDAQSGPVSAASIQEWLKQSPEKIRCHQFLSPCGFAGLGLVCEIKESEEFAQSEGFVSQGKPSRFCGSTFQDRFGQVPPLGYPGILGFSLPFTTTKTNELEAWKDAEGNFFVIPPAVIPEPEVVEPVPEPPPLQAPQVAPAQPEAEPQKKRTPAIEASQPEAKPNEPAKPAADPQPKPTFLANLGGPLDAPLLVLLHDINGTTTSYAQILPFLIQDWFVLGSIPPLGKPRDVAADASRIISALKENWPNTPIHLLGIGYGGLPAMEAAIRLRSAGEDVPFLVTAGTPPPVPEKSGWLGSLKRSISGSHAKASEPNSLESLVSSYQPRPLEGPFGVILTKDLPQHSKQSWQELAPDAAIEVLDCSSTEMITSRAADFAKALRSLAGLV